MKSFLLAPALAAGLIAFLAPAQTTPAQTTPSAPPQTPVAPVYTLKAGTQLVIIDVAVRDKRGKPVHGLTQSDFTLTEGSRTQQIRNFEEHSALSPEALAAIPPHPPLPPGDFTNLVTTPQTGALNIILIDVLNSAVNNQMYMRTQLLDYLKHARPDSRTAIYALTTHLVQLQGFTSDPKLLLAAFDAKGKPKAAVLRDDLTGGLPNSESNSIAGEFQAHNATLGGGDFDPAISAFEAPVNEYHEQLRAYTTLDALNALGRTLAQLPGRKNLIWFAGDFPAEFFPSDTPSDGLFALTSALDDEFRDTVNLLSRAQIAVYPIDSQGLRSDQSNTADKSNGRYAGVNALSAAASDSTSEFNLRANEHFSMQQIAQDTGGQAFENSNDLSRGTAQAIDDGANFYTLAYTPNGDSTHEGFRHIAVKVKDPSLKLSYRRGYYTQHSARVAAATRTPPPSSDPLQQALLPGAPPPTEILLRVHAAPQSTAPQPTIADGNLLNPHPKNPIAGPFRLIKVSTAASVRNMSFTHGTDNIIHTTIDFVTNVYDDQGNFINVQANTLHADYKPDELPTLLRGGITYDQLVSVPLHGEYFLRVAVHDHAGHHTGAVELPVDAIRNLPPAASPANTAAPSSAH